MTPLLKKIMAMARKTGDRCIVLDPSGEEAFVLMDLNSYERLVIDRDVASITSGSLAGARDDLRQGSGASRLTAKTGQDKIEPDKERWELPPPKEAPIEGFDTFAEPSEEKVLRDERFFIEPIE